MKNKNCSGTHYLSPVLYSEDVMRLRSKARLWRGGMVGCGFLLLAYTMAWGQTCPPPGSTTITSCCDYGLNPAPCGIQVPRLYLKNVVPPSVTLTPDAANPNYVHVTVNNGSALCADTGACTGAYCGPPIKYIKTPYET